MKQSKINLVFKALKLDDKGEFLGKFGCLSYDSWGLEGGDSSIAVDLNSYAESIGVCANGLGWTDTLKVIRTKQAEIINDAENGGDYDIGIIGPILGYELDKIGQRYMPESIEAKLTALSDYRKESKEQIDSHVNETEKPEALAPDEARALEQNTVNVQELIWKVAELEQENKKLQVERDTVRSINESLGNESEALKADKKHLEFMLEAVKGQAKAQSILIDLYQAGKIG